MGVSVDASAIGLLPLQFSQQTYIFEGLHRGRRVRAGAELINDIHAQVREGETNRRLL